MAEIFAYIVHKDKVADDCAFELLSAAKKIDSSASVTAIVVGDSIADLCDSLTKHYNKVWKIEDSSLSYPNAEVIRKVLETLVPKDAIVLFGHDTFGMDIAPGLSVKLDSPFISDAVDIEAAGSELKAVRQEYGGAVSTHVSCDISSGLVITVRPGSFQPQEDGSAGGQVEEKSADISSIKAGRRFVEVLEAPAGDVDITKEEILVSVGRGIEDQDNISIAEDLAAAMGGVVSCSRPIVDAKWLEKSRQVGTSGQTVKPKVYLACGISGSFQHMGGIKGNPFMVAINKNPKAPIFQFADVGIEADILEFIPELTDKVQEAK